eukprot:m51a1_g10226 hypothetical protein (135) ;mRNA; f:139657-140171
MNTGYRRPGTTVGMASASSYGYSASDGTQYCAGSDTRNVARVGEKPARTQRWSRVLKESPQTQQSQQPGKRESVVLRHVSPPRGDEYTYVQPDLEARAALTTPASYNADKCPKCGTRAASASAKFCVECGHRFA